MKTKVGNIALVLLVGLLFTNQTIKANDTLNLEQKAVSIIIKELENDSTLQYLDFYISEHTHTEGPSVQLIRIFNTGIPLEELVKEGLDSADTVFKVQSNEIKELTIPSDYQKRFFLIENRERIAISNKRKYKGNYYIKFNLEEHDWKNRIYIIKFDKKGNFKEIGHIPVMY